MSRYTGLSTCALQRHGLRSETRLVLPVVRKHYDEHAGTFAQAFGKALQLQWVQPGDLAAQLLGSGPPGAAGGVKPCGRSADAPVAALHTALLDMVRCNCIKVKVPDAQPGMHKQPRWCC